MIKCRVFSALFFLGFTIFSSATYATSFGDKTIVGTKPGTPYEKAIKDVTHFLGASSKDVKKNNKGMGFVNKLMGENYPEEVTIEHKSTIVKLSFIPVRPYKSKNHVVVLSINVRQSHGILDPYDQLVSKFGQPSNMRDDSSVGKTYYWCENIQKNGKYGCAGGKSLTARYDYVIYQDPSLSSNAVFDGSKSPSI